MATTSLAGLSRRSPLNDAWRIMPDAVQPANSISATSVGFSHRMFFDVGGAFAPPKGLVARVNFSRVGSNLAAKEAL